MHRRPRHRQSLFIAPLLLVVGCLGFFGLVKLFRAKAPIVEAQGAAVERAQQTALFERAELLFVDEAGDVTGRPAGVATRTRLEGAVLARQCQVRVFLPQIDRVSTRYVAWMVQDEPFTLTPLAGELVPFQGEWFVRAACEKGTHLAVTRQRRDAEYEAPSQRLVFGAFKPAQPEELPVFPSWEEVLALHLTESSPLPTEAPAEARSTESL